MPLAAKPSTGSFRADGWQAAALVVLPLFAYARLAHAGFVWDDATTLTANPLVHAADGLRRLWFTRQPTDYWPVTFSSFWAEWRIWGLWAPGYHLTNVGLHIAEALLLWRLLVRLSIPGAFFAALWFALHPLNVESVAWIAQRKNLLAMLFFLLGLRAFAESSVIASGRIDRWWGLTALAFLLSVLSKGSTVTLPLVLVGWVWWHRRLCWRDLLWASPLLVAATAFAALNVWFAQHLGADAVRPIGLGDRIAGAGGAFWFYLGKVFWPAGLCFVYPGWTVPPVNPVWWWGLALALLATVFLWLRRNRGNRAELAAWLYFTAMLLPVLGLTDVYFMQYSLVADHYAHLAMVGVLAWAAARLMRWDGARAVGWVVAVALGLLTFRQSAIYANDIVLFHSVLARNPASWMAHNNLGTALMKEPGGIDSAITEFRAALRLKPDFAEAHNDLGSALMSLPGQAAEAVQEFRQALQFRPDYPEAHVNLGNVLSKSPDGLNEAAREYEAALHLRPELVEAHDGLGLVWSKTPGRLVDAVGEYKMALRLKPDDVVAHFNLGNAWLRTPGHLPEAISQYQDALRLMPDYPAIHFNLAVALVASGHRNEAAAQLEATLRLQPENAMARKLLKQLQSSN